jgi:DNA-binding MarR family transcriptional regulator
LGNLKEEIKLADSKSVFMDKEYIIMSEIIVNENVTQRELSRELGISVSTVNALVNKMIKEGLIKMTQVSQKQVFYMLTPVGMMEKAKKTVSYLKAHYRAIYQTKEKIKDVLEELDQEHDAIFVLLSDDEMAEVLSIAVSEFQSNHNKSKIKIIDYKKKNEIKSFKSPVLIYMIEDEEALKEYTEFVGLKLVNLTERL